LKVLSGKIRILVFPGKLVIAWFCRFFVKKTPQRRNMDYLDSSHAYPNSRLPSTLGHYSDQTVESRWAYNRYRGRVIKYFYWYKLKFHRLYDWLLQQCY
jgi:hypothetical protein